MPGNYRNQVEGYTYWDAAETGLPIGMYSQVALATAAEVATANAAGVQGNVGELVVPAPVSSGLPTRRVVGVVQHSAKNGQEVEVAVAGVSLVMVNAAVALDAVLFAAAAETRTAAQTPFADNFEMLIASDPSVPLTYNLVLADDTALPSAGVVHWPLGHALVAATAKYDIIPVSLQLGYMR